MVTVYDVPANALIGEAAGRLEGRIEQPDWMAFVKSDQIRELPSQQDDFWYVRGTNLPRRIAMSGPVGVDRFLTEYDGLKHGSNRYSVSGAHSNTGGKNIVRTLLRQLEEGGLVEAIEGKGRRITAEGVSFLSNTAFDVFSDLDRPELERYA